jgi:hypothetical protein
MVSGGISLEARTELVIVEHGSITARRYITECLQDHVVPYAEFIGENFILMQDKKKKTDVPNFVSSSVIITSLRRRHY